MISMEHFLSITVSLLPSIPAANYFSGMGWITYTLRKCRQERKHFSITIPFETPLMMVNFSRPFVDFGRCTINFRHSQTAYS